jgi:hypothetical protein
MRPSYARVLKEAEPYFAMFPRLGAITSGIIPRVMSVSQNPVRPFEELRFATGCPAEIKNGE